MRRTLAAAVAVVTTASGCAFQGLNSLPLPGAVGRGPDAHSYTVEIDNVATLESNSPVLINDVVVGSVGKMEVKGWHAQVQVSVQPDVVVPGNAVAKVGQTSLLGSLHLALDPPPGEAPSGRLQPGSTIALNESSTYPTTEQTLASLSVVLNAGGLGQIGDIINNFNDALAGRETDFRDLFTRLDTFIGTLDTQRDNLIKTLEALNRLAVTFAGQRDVINEALRDIPPALDVLIRERPRLTTALQKLGTFSDTATGLVNDSKADLVRNLRNLEPTIRALADVGPDLGAVLAYSTTFPFPQDLLDRGLRGDYFNLFSIVDFTVPSLRRDLGLGTRFENPDRPLVPAPGDPYFLRYTYDPLGLPVGTPLPGGPLGAVPGFPPTPQLDASTPGADNPANQAPRMPIVDYPVLPVAPPPASVIAPANPQALPPAGGPPSLQIFAGPYPAAGGGG